MLPCWRLTVFKIWILTFGVGKILLWVTDWGMCGEESEWVADMVASTNIYSGIVFFFVSLRCFLSYTYIYILL